jgi:hypothetical protein
VGRIAIIAPPARARCPRCGFDNDEAAGECARCGVVFAKLEAPDGAAVETAGATVPPTGELADDPPPLVHRAEQRRCGLEPEARNALLIGAGLAALVLALPFVRFVFSYMTILVHELGHAIFAWLFGYPAIPAFDFHYGGGFTSYENRKTLLLLLIFAGWACAIWAYRRHRPGLAAVAGLAGLYTLVALTPLHEQLIGFMGHGTELIFAAIFLYRALSGSAVRLPVERPLYAFVGWFILASDVRFALGLIWNPAERQLYADAKGGGDWMDFSQIARFFGAELEAVAGIFCVMALLVVPATWAVYRHRHALGAALAGTFLAPWRTDP